MSRGRHARGKLRLGWIPVLVGFVAVLTLLLAGAAFAGYRYDRATSSRILPGVSIAGVGVGGMTRAQAARALEPVARSILDRSIQVRAGARDWSVTSGGLGTKVDVAGAVDRALSIQGSMGWTSRLYHRLLHRPVNRTIGLDVSYDSQKVWKFVHGMATDVDRKPQDASLDFVDGKLVTTRSKSGVAVREARVRRSLLGALRSGGSTVDVNVKRVLPAVSEKDLGFTIIVRTSLEKLFLYDGVKLLKTYSVATGQPQFPTPLGHFEIVNKRINPTWINPALDSWGAGEPAMIPPGPDNPLGTRAMDLSAPGIRIHGTPDDASIGHAASHGCIRMHIPDSEDLFNRVDVGTPVIIAY
jgi:hypothetical protein